MNINLSPSRFACSKASFIAVIALIITSSAFPVKSDAFSILNNRGGGARIGKKAPVQKITTLNPQPHFAPPDVIPSFEGNEVLGSGVNNNDVGDTKLRSAVDSLSSFIKKADAFVSRNFFLVGMMVAVSFSKLFPELGKNGSVLRPELFIGKYGVTTIFLLSGLSIKLKELTNAAVNMKLNGLIQLISFGAWPFLVGLPLTKGVEFMFPNLLPPALLDGLLILCCLPTTLNMCILLTSKAEGSVASALCNAVISNLGGIFITPALFLHFFGKSIELPFLDLVRKLCSKVLLPVAVGQALRATPVKAFYSKHTGFFKRFQECVILGIVWNAFCNAFTSGLGLELKHAVVLLTMLPALHAASLTSLFSFFQMELFRFTAGEAKAATFCGAHKTLAFGLPLINTIFEGNPNLASYCAPLMIMHPLQIVIGSLMMPYLSDAKIKHA